MHSSTQAPPSTPDEKPSSTDPLRELRVGRAGRPWKRIVGSFFLIFGIYWLYALAVVPFIEPSAELRADLDETPLDQSQALNVVEAQKQSLTPWFKPGDWELDSPKVFESPRGKLLMHRYHTLEDGRLKIEPCTMILLSEGGTENPVERNRRAVILQAPQGAILKFDTKVDLKQMKIGKLTGGTLLGPITIRSDQRLPGPEDDLLITTRDAELIGDRVVTPHPVDFRLGPNNGSGRDLEIHLAPGTSPQPNSPAPGFSGVNSLSLKRDVRMRLVPGQADLFPDPAAVAATPVAASTVHTPVAAANNPPVDITCDGAFQFDVNRYAATFRQRVNVLRVNNDAPSDQLTCELLSVFFEPVGGAAAPPGAPAAPRGGFPKLEPSRVEAEGNPVVIRSPGRGIQARGTRLEYDVKKNAGSLRGPGWFKGVRPEEAAPRPIEATWTRELEFGPHDGLQRAKMAGDAHVESLGVGELNAETILLFFVEDSAPPNRPGERRRLVPDRMQAFERVHFMSPQLSGDVDHLQVWLQHPAPGAVPATPTGLAGAPAETLPAPAHAQPANPLAPANALAANPAAPQRHVHVSGQLIQVEARIAEKAADVSRIRMQGKVVLRELKGADAGTRPLLVRGDQIDVDQPAPSETIVHVVGQPAHIEAREMSIDAADIHLDRAQNRAWVNGQGLMTLLVPNDLANQPSAQPRPLEITWKKRMDFDGRQATFVDDVVAIMQRQRVGEAGAPVAEHQQLNSDWLQASFEPPVMFDQMTPAVRPTVSQVMCRGNVYLEQQTTEAGRKTALERVHAADLTARPATGDMLARGPGWVRRVWVDTGQGMPRLPGAQPVSARPAQLPTGNRLAYLGINFQDRLMGNQQRQTMDFHQRVRCVYGPVPDWDTILDPDDPDKLGEGGALLSSDRLQVVRIAVGQAKPTFELTALGNAQLEGRTTAGQKEASQATPVSAGKGQMFSATGARISYSEAKEQMIIEGDGRNFAHLSRQVRVGAPYDEQSAGKFLFWPRTNQFQAQDAHTLSIESLEAGTGRRQPAGPAAPGQSPARPK